MLLPVRSVTTAIRESNQAPVLVAGSPLRPAFDGNMPRVRAIVRSRRTIDVDDSVPQYWDVGLPKLYHAICTGSTNVDGIACRECNDPRHPSADAFTHALRRERKCIEHVALLEESAQTLPFAEAACIAAYTRNDHRFEAWESQILHRQLNKALFNAYADDERTRATAAAATALMRNLIERLRSAIMIIAMRRDVADEVLAATAANGDLRVYRGVGLWAYPALSTLRRGDRRFFPAFTSTSTARGVAHGFGAMRSFTDAGGAGHTGGVLEITVPREFRWMAAPISRWSTNEAEREVLIMNGAIVEVLEDVNYEDQMHPTPPTIRLRVIGAITSAGELPPGLGDDRDGRSGGDGAAVGATTFHSGEGASAPGGDAVGFDSSAAATGFSVSVNADPRALPYFAPHWAPPCQLAADNPLGLPLSAVAGSRLQPAPHGATTPVAEAPMEHSSRPPGSLEEGAAMASGPAAVPPEGEAAGNRVEDQSRASLSLGTKVAGPPAPEADTPASGAASPTE